MEITPLRQQDFTVQKNPDMGISAGTEGMPLDIKQVAVEPVREVILGSGPLNINENTAAVIKDILSSVGFNLTPENMEMVLNLMNNNMPVNKETMQKFNQALKLMGLNVGENKLNDGQKSENVDKAVFLLKNDLPVSKMNTLERFLKEDTTISKNLDSLLKAIDDLPDGNLKAELKEILTKDVKELLDTKSLETGLKDINTSSKEVDSLENLKNTETTKETQGNTGIKEAVISKDSLKEVLTNIKGNNLNTENGHKALENVKMPVTKEALETILKENTPLNEKQITEFAKAVINNEGSDITNLLKMAKSPDTALKDNIKMEAKEIIDKFTVSLNNAKTEEIDQMLNSLKVKMAKIEEAVAKSGGGHKEILDIATNVKENINFMNEIKTCIHVPLPFNTVDGKKEGELYVFNDKRKKKTGSSVSALIALNTTNIGRVETYVQKNEKSLNLQFRLENNKVKALVNKNKGKLENLLKVYGYSIQSINIIDLESPFNILSKEPEVTEQAKAKGVNKILFDRKA